VWRGAGCLPPRGKGWRGTEQEEQATDRLRNSARLGIWWGEGKD
jgi:hypothetical protein